MKKIVLFLLVGVLLSGTLRAAAVSPETAATVARNFMARQGVKAALSPKDCGVGEMFLFTAADGGFVLVAADDCVRPILAYSLTARFADTLPDHIASWLQGYAGEIALLRSRGETASLQVRAEWDALLKADGQGPLYTVVVAPMLTTTWKQGSPYNTLCPLDTQNRKTIAGCVAIAMAQVMKYWNHPTQGVGSYSYTTASYGTLSADFGATTYDWTNMSNSLTSVSPSVNINAVATLVYHAGVSVKMGYGYSSSSATTTSANNLSTITGERALRTYFKYDKALHSVRRDVVGDSVFTALLEGELLAGRPVIFSGRDTSGGHAFVCDGGNNAGLYHFNWGWGGYCDGYYQIGALNPAPGGDGGNATSHYNLQNKMIIGIQPDTLMAGTYTLNALPDSPAHGSVTGGGSHAYGDTVELTALAAGGYRFARWDDGMCYNSRNLIMGGDRTLTALYDSVGGDTLRYDNGFFVTSWGFSTARPYYWGMQIEPALLAGHTHLDAVQVYLKAGTYQMSIYSGSTPSAATLADTMPYAAAEEGWYTLTLDSALALNTSLPLWIVFYNDDITYPACAGTYCGHQLAAYSNTNGTSWGTSSTRRTFLIRGIFSTVVPPEPPAPLFDTTVAEACGSYLWEDSTYSVSGTYERLFTASTGADSLRVLLLTIHPDYHLFDTVAAVDSFRWVNSQVYTESGVYDFDTLTVYGCDSLLTLVLTVTYDTTTQAITQSSIQAFSIYPNPTTGVVQLEGVEEVEIYDLYGRKVSEFRAPNSEVKISLDLSDLPVGTYLFRVRRPQGAGIYRVVKK